MKEFFGSSLGVIAAAAACVLAGALQVENGVAVLGWALIVVSILLVVRRVIVPRFAKRGDDVR